jgi:hypothetical protein
LQERRSEGDQIALGTRFSFQAIELACPGTERGQARTGQHSVWQPRQLLSSHFDRLVDPVQAEQEPDQDLRRIDVALVVGIGWTQL